MGTGKKICQWALTVSLIHVFRYTVNDFLSMFEDAAWDDPTTDQSSSESEEEDGVANMCMLPPVELPVAASDCDSDLSDNENTGNLNRLPRRLLNAECCVSGGDQQIRKLMRKNNVFESDEDETPVKKARKCDTLPDNDMAPQPPPLESSSSSEHESDTEDVVSAPPAQRRNIVVKGAIGPKRVQKKYAWSNELKPVYSIPNRDHIYHPSAQDLLKENAKSPGTVFLSMFPPNLVDILIRESNLYSQQNGRNLGMDKTEALSFLGILLLSGYNRLPYRRLYWSESADVRNSLVSDSMRRNRFDDIIRDLHFRDNTNLSGDRYYKVRPLFGELNGAFKQADVAEDISIDETMVPYFGKHGTKQFIRGKPIRFGFKLWSLASSTGYMYHVEPYCGSSTRLPNTGYGQGTNVVLGLVD